jgi:hypothetical protein
MTKTRYELKTIAGQLYVAGIDAKGIKRTEWVASEGYGLKLVEYRNARLGHNSGETS